mmetsp:Transcript_23917/g.28939  ORF Transcript_23917/g.28939 Transcript_23917/m.28939 type:complete len:166 (-) Transcript_23917:119-616(-)|eukprot:CAMPEP_0197850978 /NCGR_PEP_ID=MMETSP1438-20131217/16910_1 /TAXON_ID=1461541 /ORGANISM="Pterosperma sp., Strain CCMP1384" /LENGTH=165 /DNA_ID=CAMNT_0043464419 /DNA_START=178 /DNA_END=675 /DNA_ORIENTATION=+
MLLNKEPCYLQAQRQSRSTASASRFSPAQSVRHARQKQLQTQALLPSGPRRVRRVQPQWPIISKIRASSRPGSSGGEESQKKQQPGADKEDPATRAMLIQDEYEELKAELFDWKDWVLIGLGLLVFIIPLNTIGYLATIIAVLYYGYKKLTKKKTDNDNRPSTAS